MMAISVILTLQSRGWERVSDMRGSRLFSIYQWSLGQSTDEYSMCNTGQQKAMAAGL